MRAAPALVVLTACLAAGCSPPKSKRLDLWLSPIHGETALVLSPTRPGFY